MHCATRTATVQPFGVYVPLKSIDDLYNMSERRGATRKVTGQSSASARAEPEAVASGLVSRGFHSAVKTRAQPAVVTLSS